MLGVGSIVPLVTLLSMFVSAASSSLDATNRKPAIIGAPAHNLRADAGIEYPLNARFQAGGLAAIQYRERELHPLISASRENESPRQYLVMLAEDNPLPSSDSAEVSPKVPSPEPKEPARENIPATPARVQSAPATKLPARSQPSKPPTPAKNAASVAEPKEPKALPTKSPSILQMLEGHENELMIAAAIGIAFFFIGWICGGNYYLRRDRRRRSKIRF
jgi:hypothetical protein